MLSNENTFCPYFSRLYCDCSICTTTITALKIRGDVDFFQLSNGKFQFFNWNETFTEKENESHLWKVLLWLKLRWKVLISPPNSISPDKMHPGFNPLMTSTWARSGEMVDRLAESFFIICLSTIAEAQKAKESKIPPVTIFWSGFRKSFLRAITMN